MESSGIPSDLIPRKDYSRRIKPFIGKPLVKVFTGQRRVGKSYIMYQMMKEVMQDDPDAHIVYINKEDHRFDFIRSHTDLVDYIGSGEKVARRGYLFIDEIQEITEFEKAVRSLLLKGKYDIYITGSNAQLLSGEFATLLGGRTVEFKVYCLSYREFLEFHKLTDSEESLAKYSLYGGLPFLINLQLTDEIVTEYLKNIYNTIVLRDVVSRHGLRNIRFLEQLVMFLADNTGSLFSAKSISDFLRSQQIKIPHNQVQAYTGYLSDAFLIHRVPRYDISRKRYFETGEKFYFGDPGLRNAIVGYKPGDQAKILENLVFNELLNRGYRVSTGWKGNREIDFIAEKDNEKQYIQVTLALDHEETVNREFGNLLQIPDNYPKLVISASQHYRNTIQGVEHMNIRRFLVSET